MATYFNQSHEIQPESIQTLYLMNPDFTSYSDAPPQTNMIYLNPSLNPVSTLSQPQHLVGIPIQRPLSSTQHRLSLGPPIPEEAKVAGLINSKYLRFAQQLLDEVASVSKGIKDESLIVKRMDSKLNGEEVLNEKGSAELTISEMQEIQMKKAKLVDMLDEVIQRHKQYHQQMQVLASSFEAVAGVGSAKSYTSLALQTISKQFRCLRDAITGQIRDSAKNLGEDGLNGGGTGSKGSRLQFVDQQVKQQRALQQLGMIHNNAWKPQRGLPERSVSILRAWLFEHFLHPYPKDSDKKMLAKQTGLTRSQVSNWFINARVRLWKPMVEEMYKEEMKGQEQSNINENSETDVNEDSSSKFNAHQDNSPKITDQIYTHPPIMVSSYDDDENLFVQSKLKKARNDDKSMNRENQTHDYSFITGSTNIYSVGEIERFGIEQFAPRVRGRGVSLTLGLTNYDSLSLSGEGQAYLSNENNGFTSLNRNHQSVAHAANGYGNISIESRKRFASQLLQDFVV